MKLLKICGNFILIEKLYVVISFGCKLNEFDFKKQFENVK